MLKVAAYAKFDLGIHISPKKKADGYYPVYYIDCQIDLCDTLFLERIKDKIEIICSDPAVPIGRENFIYRAAVMLKEMAGSRELGVRVNLSKSIPVKAGFGGGSSDAAAAVFALSKLWRVKIGGGQQKQLAKSLGKDFYYSLHGKLCEVFGDGQSYRLAPIAGIVPIFWLLVVVPFEEKPSTGWVYEHLRLKNIGRNFGKMARLKEALSSGNNNQILANLTNDFEKDVGSHYEVVTQLKKDLKRAGALSAIMAGAGLSVVGFFESKEEVEAGKEKLKGNYKQILVARTIN